MRKLLLSAVCALAISAAVAGGSSGPPNIVRSVFGRVGAVVAAANDYAIGQISGLGTNVATALGNAAGAASGFALYAAPLPGATGTSGPTAGNVGYVVSASATSQAIANSTTTNITSLSVPAGHWSCTGWITTNPAGTTVQGFVNASLSTTSATGGGFPSIFTLSAAVNAGGRIEAEFGPQIYNFATPTVVYNVQFISYSISTLTSGGGIQCQQTP